MEMRLTTEHNDLSICYYTIVSSPSVTPEKKNQNAVYVSYTVSNSHDDRVDEVAGRRLRQRI